MYIYLCDWTGDCDSRWLTTHTAHPSIHHYHHYLSTAITPGWRCGIMFDVCRRSIAIKNLFIDFNCNLNRYLLPNSSTITHTMSANSSANAHRSIVTILLVKPRKHRYIHIYIYLPSRYSICVCLYNSIRPAQKMIIHTIAQARMLAAPIKTCAVFYTAIRQAKWIDENRIKSIARVSMASQPVSIGISSSSSVAYT